MRSLTPQGRFVLRFGIAAYGGGLFLLLNVVHVLRLRGSGESLSGLPLWIAGTAILSVAFGATFGMLMWRLLLRRKR